MKGVTSRFVSTLILISFAALTPSSSQGQVLFSDDFDSDTSAAWSVFDGSASGTPDFTAEFFFDYSVHGIPSAPG